MKKSRQHKKNSGLSLRRKRVCFCCAVLMALSIVLLPALPPARLGLMALCNRLFSLSEQANAYAYARFPVPEDQSTVWAWLLIACFLGGYAGLAAALKSRLPLLLLAVLSAAAQAYFGLSLPTYGNILFFLLLGVGVMLFSAPPKCALAFAAAAVLTALLSVGLWPGVDAATEAASETARDHLALVTTALEEGTGESPAAPLETRHVNTRSLISGEAGAPTGREYRLLTVEEQQISQPHWIDYLKILLLLLAAAGAVFAPFAPFWYLNACRKKALEARRAFAGENVGEALCAMFRLAAAYLENGGCGEGNRPFRAWDLGKAEKLPEDYRRRFAACARLFEEAAYSDHAFSEEQREEMRQFLSETERVFFDEADWKEKLRLRYIKCLHE